MKLTIQNRNLILVSLLIVALLPYFTICFYALPYGDDFGYAWTASEKIPFVQKFLKQYLGWSGRYTADVLVSLHPLTSGKIFVYQLFLFFPLLATPIVFFVFVRQILKDNTVAIVSALFITLFYLSYLPNLTEGVYWYTGIAHYHLGNLLLLLQITLLLRLIEKEKRSIPLEVISFLLLIISIGFNDIGALLIPFFYLSATLFALFFKTNNSKIFIVHTVIAIVAAIFALLAPGNFNRGDEFPERYQFFNSVFYASLQTIRFISKWSLNYPFIVLSLVIVANSEKLSDNFTRKIDYRLLIVGLLISVFTASFVPYFATGILGQHRTLNYILFFFILLWLWLLISACHHFSLYQKIIFFRNKFVIGVVLISSLLVIIFTRERNLIHDLTSGAFTLYKNEFLERQKNILQNTSGNIQPMQFIPSTFTIVDARGDSTFSADRCMKKFYEETKIELK